MIPASLFRAAARVSACCFFSGLSLSGGVAAPVQIAVQSFDLHDVRLLDGPFKQAMDLNSRYLLSLEPDRFLCYFRKNAGLEPKAQAYGGWEAPDSGAGRCLGHYLSALSLQFRASGDARFKERVDYIVDELSLCQQTNGLLTAQAGVKEAFAELARGKGDALRKSRVPWYVQHKMFAGLRDAYLLTGNEKAKTVLVRMSDWAVEVTQALDETQFQVMLEQEHGGMREVLADVYAITGNTKYLELANRFSHFRIMAPLEAGRDELGGLHANTQIPKLTGSARIYELTGDAKERDAATFFWDCVVRHHSYAIGGDSDDEHFDPPDQLAHHLTAATCETCNTYNMLKLTRHLFTWKPDVEYADYYERALYNQILASQEPGSGMFTYFVSLKPGHFRTYSTPTNSFWCCVGTGMENQAQYGNSIYFHTGDNLFVNLFIPSELTWKDKHVVVKQETRYPESDRTVFTVASPEPALFTFNFRYPGWALPGLEIKVNGEAVATPARPGIFVPVRREWHNGDKIEVKIPMGLRTEALPDDPNKIAIFYGPLVLGGELGTGGLPESLEARDQGKFRKVPDPEVPALATGRRPVELWLKPVAGQNLAFRTEGVGRPHDVTLVPFYREYHERYTVYWDVLNESSPQN
ncbi:MAG TPA: beta-L-arabinofuranosidase domain-containing protein [Verrucomicrobiae bacterium]|nr:beta-L-arabinofuranosidase domain-containing protein [Verrucomicrobiae bacterium]